MAMNTTNAMNVCQAYRLEALGLQTLDIHRLARTGEHAPAGSAAGQRTSIAGLRVQALDATGAGDCFAGNLLARLAAGQHLVEASCYANAAAAVSVQGYGAVAPLPRPQQVLPLLKASPAGP